MESEESDIAWWRAAARAIARTIVGAVRSITRADLILIGCVLVLWTLGLFVWPAIPTMGLTFLPFAVRLFIWPERAVEAVKKRIEEGDDRYFEEQRGLRVYSITRAPRVRRQAAFVIVLCVAWSVMEVYRYHLQHS